MISDGKKALLEGMPGERCHALVLCHGDLKGAERAEVEESERLVPRPRYEPVWVRWVPLKLLDIILVTRAAVDGRVRDGENCMGIKRSGAPRETAYLHFMNRLSSLRIPQDDQVIGTS